MILDCDLLIGREATTAVSRSATEVRRRLDQAGMSGGAVASLRSISHDPRTGNAEATDAARAHGWIEVCGVDLRNPVEAEQLILEAEDLSLIHI